MRGGASGPTIGTRLILHLSCYSRFQNDYVCPFEMTQQGIAEKLGISREHVAAELWELKRKKLVTFKTGHVSKARTVRKVFFLTQAGELFARKLKGMMSVDEAVVFEGNRGLTHVEIMIPSGPRAASV